MALYKFSDKIVFNILSDIKIGYLEITNYQGEIFKVGNLLNFRKDIYW